MSNPFIESSSYFPTPLQEFQFFDKYSRYNYDFGRRETWTETVHRSVDFLANLSEYRLGSSVYDEIERAILTMKVMPSMRLLAMAGPAAYRQNLCIYNCASAGINSIDTFVEALIISMSGCGFGFSVENQFICQLPVVKTNKGGYNWPTFTVPDSAEGWAQALRLGLESWFNGEDIYFDLSELRPAGAPLKTKGGQASGPEPLFDLLQEIKKIILRYQGKQLSSLAVHDIMCHIGSAAVSGGTRRTAMLSLFDINDFYMMSAKSGEFPAHRWNANNSRVWTNDISLQEVQHQFNLMNLEMNGEPGIFNRDAITNSVPERRVKSIFSTNPCGEIILRASGQLCNLSMAVARVYDTLETLKEKVRLATIIGTIQSMATHFPGLRSIWKENCEEERLLGVDITGQMDCPAVQDSSVMQELKKVAIDTNREFSALLGINQSAAVTCVKPSGNSSTLLDCSSGLHARFAPYYVRRVRVGAHSPVFKVLKEHNVPLSPENGQDENSAITWVASFPIKSPDFSTVQNELSAIDQCEYWLKNKVHWTEHNPSVTIRYDKDELPTLIQWVWNHKTLIGGMSFLPKSDIQYDQAPYEEITKDQYEEMVASFPTIDWSMITEFEYHDMTEAAATLSCFAGSCEL